MNRTRNKCKHGGAHGKGGCWKCLAAIFLGSPK